MVTYFSISEIVGDCPEMYEQFNDIERNFFLPQVFRFDFFVTSRPYSDENLVCTNTSPRVRYMLRFGFVCAH